MTPQDFAYLRDMLKERSGLVVTEEKKYLLECRLMPLAREHGVESMSDLVAALRAPSGEALRGRATDAMTINESFFFRDKLPFQNLAEIMIPTLLEERAKTRRIKIWCAAASTGQEPYSIAIQLQEMAHKLSGWQTDILGTDISADVLEKAKAGLYSQFEVQRGLPIQLLVKYFKQVGSLWQIDPALRAMVRYRQFNLLDGFSGLGKFDVVFCRNVLIYFDAPTKKHILERMAAQLQPDGYLVLGGAETVIGITDHFKPVPGTRGLYNRSDVPAASRTVSALLRAS